MTCIKNNWNHAKNCYDCIDNKSCREFRNYLKGLKRPWCADEIITEFERNRDREYRQYKAV